MRKKLTFTKKQITEVEKLAGYGLKVAQVADILGVSKRTFERRVAESSELFDALSRGRAKSASKVMRTAFQMASSGKWPSMTMFWLKCREGWKDPQRFEVKPIIEETPDQVVLREIVTDLSALSDEELDQEICMTSEAMRHIELVFS